MICNPITHQLIKLPGHQGFLGYDPIGDQHKVISGRLINQEHLEHKVLTLARGGGGGWRRIQGTTVPYFTTSVGVCINGFVYYSAKTKSPSTINAVVVCFDVRTEKLSLVNAPWDVIFWGLDSVLIEYKGKLASIFTCPLDRFHSFDLWVLEDVQKHEWSKQTCVIPFSLWDSVAGKHMSFPGTNKAGDIIMAPTFLSEKGPRPFYIFYYNVETKNITRVLLPGIGGDQDFRRRHGFGTHGESHVRISPRHVNSIAFFKDPI